MEHIVYLKIENDIHSAKVRELPHPHHQQYYLQFEDGYENIFFTDAETGKWIEEDIGETELAASFGTKINMIEGIQVQPLKQLTWCKASMADKIINFGFYSYIEGPDTVFEIYADNHKFLYTFKNAGHRWEVFSNSQLIKESQYNDQVVIIINIFKSLLGCM